MFWVGKIVKILQGRSFNAKHYHSHENGIPVTELCKMSETETSIKISLIMSAGRTTTESTKQKSPPGI